MMVAVCYRNVGKQVSHLASVLQTFEMSELRPFQDLLGKLCRDCVNLTQAPEGDWVCDQCSTSPAQISLCGPLNETIVSSDEGILVVINGLTCFVQSFFCICDALYQYTQLL